MAAYIPPHKRTSTAASSSAINPTPTPTPTPESLSPHFKRGLNFKSSSFSDKKNNRARGTQKNIVYAENAVSKWFQAGLASDDTDNNDATRFTSLTRLEPVFCAEFFQRKSGEKPLSLVINHDRVKECSEKRSVFMESPWLFVAENVKHDLISAFERVQNEMQDNDFVQVKPMLVARFGRILFHGGQPTLPESTLRQLKRSFYTDVSASYMERIVNEVVPKLRLEFEEERELYHVQLSDKMEPDSTISCKCTLAREHKKLELCRIAWNHVRHLVVDISCLDKNLDLRLMLCNKKIIKTMSDDEMKCIKSLIGAAILDPEVKGGLRWPLGTDSSGDRYAVVGVWHVSAKAFRKSSIRLKVRYADRFNFRTSSGEVSREVNMKMPGLVSHFLEQTKQDDLCSEMLRSNLKLMWDNFLCDAGKS